MNPLKMASLSQSESESENSTASLALIGEKVPKLPGWTLTGMFWTEQAMCLGDDEDIMKLFCDGRGGITTFISGPMVLFGGKLSYSTKNCFIVDLAWLAAVNCPCPFGYCCV